MTKAFLVVTFPDGNPPTWVTIAEKCTVDGWYVVDRWDSPGEMIAGLDVTLYAVIVTDPFDSDAEIVFLTANKEKAEDYYYERVEEVILEHEPDFGDRPPSAEDPLSRREIMENYIRIRENSRAEGVYLQEVKTE